MAPSAFSTHSSGAAKIAGRVARLKSFSAGSAHRPSQRPRHSGGGGEGRVNRSGEIVRETGIYEVTHDRAHRAAHEVVMLAGGAFPACETCESRVRFRLVRTAPYIFQD